MLSVAALHAQFPGVARDSSRCCCALQAPTSSTFLSGSSGQPVALRYYLLSSLSCRSPPVDTYTQKFPISSQSLHGLQDAML